MLAPALFLSPGGRVEQNHGRHEERARVCAAQEDRRAAGRPQAGTTAVPRSAALELRTYQTVHPLLSCPLF